MAEGPTIPEHPRLELDPAMSPQERLRALREHYVELRRINEDLEEQLDAAAKAAEALRSRVERVERKNAALKRAPQYIATVADIFDDELIIRQHGSNQEVVVDFPERMQADIDPGTRVAVSDSFAVETVLEAEVDARARGMEVVGDPNVTYDDIGGLDDQIREVREAVELPLRDPERFSEVGVDPPSGVLLHGPPGTGKTMLAKAAANKTDATFIRMAGSELIQKFIGEGSRLVRDLFEFATERQPAIVFIDEIDSIASQRVESKTSGDAEVQRTMMQLLSEMDGFEDREGVRIMAATNRFDMLDPAILRPGRFDRLIEVPLPTDEARERIFELHSDAMNIADDVDFGGLASLTEGASGAEIKATCTEAGMFAIRDGRTLVTREDFAEAYAKIRETDSTVVHTSPSVY